MKRFNGFIFVWLLLSITLYSQKYNIADYGAVSDNKTLNTISIQKAIDACNANGGGTVIIPTGIFITGTLDIKSNVNLYLESGAILKGSGNLADYRFYQSPIFSSPSLYGIIYAHKAENVSITGQGSINGNEEAFFIWDKAKSIDKDGTKNTRQKDNYRFVESGIGDGPVVPKDRPRQMVIFSECKNVLVRDVIFTKSPFWTFHLVDCDGVTINGLKIWNSMSTPNSDGIDITSCSNVTVANCDIRTGDDAIVITGFAHHFELPGYFDLRHPSGNINVTNCNLQSRSSGIRIGYQDQNSVKNINISNINITNSNRGIGIFLRDEGSLENISFTNINIETRLHTGDWWGNGEPIHISAVRGTDKEKLGKIKNVLFRDVTCKGESGILLYGTDESIIEDVKFENVSFVFLESKLNGVAGGNIDLRGCSGDHQLFASDISAFYAEQVKNLSVNNFNVRWDNVKEDYFKYGVHINKYSGLKLTNINAPASPSNKELKSVFVENGVDFITDIKDKDVEIKNAK